MPCPGQTKRNKLFKACEEGFQKGTAVRNPAVQSEIEWLEYVHNFYLFVEDRQRYFQPSEDHVLIANSRMQHEFNVRTKRADELREKYEIALTEFERAQKGNFTKLDL